MNRLYLLLLMLAFFACSDNDGPPEETPDPVSPVVLDLNEVPYQTLSEYNFFDGEMKNLDPVYGVIPYELINPLFVDYVHKKRFIWLPEGQKATFESDHEAFSFPDGSAVIKNFYYENVLPNNETKVLETRVMIRKNGQWIFAEYVWNEEQTEATLDLTGNTLDISFMHDGEAKTAAYRIPSEPECFTCHKREEIPALIGPKPQNINKTYNYTDGAMNQIDKWVEFGYLDSSTLPENIETVTYWEDTSQPLEDRVRGYVDINCAHCHRELAHCDYTPMRFAWSESDIPANLGVCVNNVEFVEGFQYIVKPGEPNRSVLLERISTNEPDLRMPIIGRSIVHEEAVELIAEWINSMDSSPCD